MKPLNSLPVMVVTMAFAVAPFAAGLAELRAETAGLYDEELTRLASPLKGISLGSTSLDISAEMRDRYEVRENFDFNDQADDDDSFNLLRLRLSADWDVSEHLRGFVQVQHSEAFGLRADPDPAAFEDRLDLQEGFVDLRTTGAVPLTLRVGRQALAFGDERLVGAFAWSNVGRSFDGLRLTCESEQWRIDLLAAKVVNHERVQPNHATHQDLLGGVYASTTRWENRTVDAYLFLRSREDVAGEDGQRDDCISYTIGLRTRALLTERWDYDCEAAVQTGEVGTDDLLAGAVHFGTGYTFKETWSEPRVGLDYSFGSGDHDPTDGDRGTFDNLYPTNHKFYGYMDFVSWRNVHNPSIGLQCRPAKGLKLKLDYHGFWLVEKKDAWYSAGGAVTRRDTTGNSGREVGQELDLLLTCQANTHLTLWLGYSHFFAGDYVRRTSPTGAEDDADFVYLMMAMKF